jgi:hypothetical protein
MQPVDIFPGKITTAITCNGGENLGPEFVLDTLVFRQDIA